MTRSRDVANIDGLLTTTGDTYYAASAATPTRLGIGSTGQVLTVAGGVPAWATAAGGATNNWSLVSTTNTTSGTSITISGLSAYKQLLVLVNRVSFATAADQLTVTINGDTTTKYQEFGLRADGAISNLKGNRNVDNTNFSLGGTNNEAGQLVSAMYLTGCQTSGFKFGNIYASPVTADLAAVTKICSVLYAGSTTVSSLVFKGVDSQAFDLGSIIIYGSTE